MYEYSTVNQTAVKQTESPRKKNQQRRKVRGHREDDGKDDNQGVLYIFNYIVY